jgi:hypothetical protein
LKRGTLLRGDCLELLGGLLKGNAARFDLVYVDPPFNAGGQRGARLRQGERVRGPLAYADSWGGLPAFLSMLEPRLAAMRDAMSERGSLWLPTPRPSPIACSDAARSAAR